MADHNFPIARSIFHVPVDLIDLDWENALRPLDPNWAQALATLMAGPSGQEEQIEIYSKPNGRFGMTAGRHRMAAANILGWATIDADILDRKGLDRRAREVSENLFKPGLSPLDRAAFVAEQVSIERARAGIAADASPQSVAAKARWAAQVKADADDASDMMSAAYGWTEAVAAAAGMTARTIRRDLELHRGIKPDVAAALRDQPIAANASQLRALAKLPEQDQREVAGMILEGGARGVSDAVAAMRQKPVPSPAQKAWSALTASWSRMDGRARKAALLQFGEAGLPAGVTLIIDGQTFGGAK